MQTGGGQRDYCAKHCPKVFRQPAVWLASRERPLSFKLKIVEEPNPISASRRRRVGKQPSGLIISPARETAFDRPRDLLGNRFVYAVISSRARGLSLGVNMNPDKLCNFDCSYCEVDRRSPSPESQAGRGRDGGGTAPDARLAVQQGQLRSRPWYQSLPAELLQLRHVALSGDGEPTLAPNFVEAVASGRARARAGRLFQDRFAAPTAPAWTSRRCCAVWNFSPSRTKSGSSSTAARSRSWTR